jgi:hypothetical protein
MVVGSEGVPCAAHVKALAGGDDGEPVAVAIVKRDGLGRRLEVCADRARLRGRRVGASCSMTSYR